MILPRNTKANTAWKVKDPEYVCSSKENLKSCFERVSYSYSELVLNTSHKVKSESFFVSKYTGRVHTIYPPPGAVKTFHKKSFKISLNTDFRYKIAISDPQFTVWTPNPITFPRTLLDVQSSAGKIFIYLEVSPMTDLRGPTESNSRLWNTTTWTWRSTTARRPWTTDCPSVWGGGATLRSAVRPSGPTLACPCPGARTHPECWRISRTTTRWSTWRGACYIKTRVA